MTYPSRFWADCSTRHFADAMVSGAAAQTIAVLPVAATEQHGPHLPCSVDTVLLNGVIGAALAQLPPELHVLFLPTQPIGFSPEHSAFAGTLSLKAETILHLWTELGESVAAAGVKKLLLLNSHGGQVSVMDLVARDLRARLGMLVYSVSWFNLPLYGADGADLNALFSAEEHRFGIHGGAIETSMMLALDPQRVEMGQAQNFSSSAKERAQRFEILGNGRSAKLGWQIQDYNAAGAVGDAAAATAEKGRLLVDAAGRALARVLLEIDRLPPGTVRDRPAAAIG